MPPQLLAITNIGQQPMTSTRRGEFALVNEIAPRIPRKTP
jgi:hypothetical protein